MKRGVKSPLRVRCRKLAFGFKACNWQPVGEFRAAEFVARRGSGFAIVHRSTKKPGFWQVSIFDEQGPVRDSQHRDVVEALGEISPKRFKLKDVG